MKLPELFRTYLLSKGLSFLTAKNYASDVRKFIAWFEATFGRSFQARDLTEDVITLFERLEEFPNRSLERYLSSLRKFSSFLLDEGLIETNPFQYIAASQDVNQKDPWRLKDFRNYLHAYGASRLTIKNYFVDINAFTNWIKERYKIDLKVAKNIISYINPGIIEEYKKRLIYELRVSPKTVNRKLSSIRKYIDFARSRGYLKDQLMFNNYQMPEKGLKLEDLQETKESERSNPPKARYKIPPVRLLLRVLTAYSLLEDYLADRIVKLLKKKKIYDRVHAVKNIPERLPLREKLIHHAKYTRPKWYKTYHNYSFTHYFHVAILIIYASAVGYIIYNSLFTDPRDRNALAGPVAPLRVLSFQGRLTDANDRPITSATDIRFGIYEKETASGSALLWQEVHHKVTPDADGVFSILLGTKNGIQGSLFRDHDLLWLGVTIGTTPELVPRQRLAAVAYAANSESLQGMLPVTDGSAGTANVVLALDSSGNLTMGGAAAPTFAATGGRFRLSGTTLLLSTQAGSNGDVDISPDGIGKIDLHKPLVNTSATGNLIGGAVEINDRVAILATESAQAAFVINNNTGGGDIIAASSSGIARFTIGNLGEITATGAISGLTGITSSGTITFSSFTGNNAVLYATAGSGVLAQAVTSTANLCLVSQSGNAPSWQPCTAGGTDALWGQSSGLLFPNNSTVDLSIGGQSTASARFAFINVSSGTPTATISAGTANNATFLTGAGNLGTTNMQTLTLGGTTTGNLSFSSAGTTAMTILPSGNVGIGTATPGERLEVVGNIISAGTSWTSRTNAVNNAWRSVTYGNGLFVAVADSGAGNRVMTSPDGINWTIRTSVPNSGWHSVTYGNGLFVAVDLNEAGNIVMTSPDGINWTTRTSAANNSWTSVTYGNGLFVAVARSGAGNRVMTSPDGINWTTRTSAADNDWWSVTYGNGMFVAVAETGAGNRVMTSPDGITWTTRTSAADNQWLSVTYGNGLFVAVANTGTGNRVMTSPDGINWTTRTSAADNEWVSVTYGRGLFVAVARFGTGNRVMTSPDGINWTIRTSAADDQWESVTYGNGLFVAVAASGWGGRVMTSGKTELNALSHNNIYQGGMTIRGSLTLSSNITVSNTGQFLCVNTTTFEVGRNNTSCSLSSARFKDNIIDLSYGLSEVMSLRPVTFNFRPEMNLGDRIEVGFIAEEVATIAPELVSYDELGRPSGVNYPNMTALLARAVQELAQSVRTTSESLIGVSTTLSEYITSNEAEVISGLASIEQVRTNIISPLAQNSQIALSLRDSKFMIHDSATSSGKVVASIDNQGNATLSGSLTANSLQTTDASISGELAVKNLSANNATVSGTLYADRIQANSIEGLEAKIATIAAQTVSSIQHPASDSTENIASGTSGTFDTFGTSLYTDFVDIQNLSVDFATFRAGLMSLGPATLFQATVLDSLSIGANFIFTQNSINTLGAPLEIQPLKQGAISFMAGAVIIETDGTLKVTENAEFAGDLSVQGKLSANIVTPLSDDPLIIQGSASVSGTLTSRKINLSFAEQAFATSDVEAVATGSAGTAFLKQYRNEITIKNPNVTDKSLIYITPVGTTNNKVLYLLRQTSEDPSLEGIEGSFTVGVNTASTTTDIRFNWIIVN
jgi:site-specific recombinase XerD